MKATELLSEQSNAIVSENNSQSSNTTVEDIKYNNQQIDDTPFFARYDHEQDVWFGTVGRYRITSNYKSYHELAKSKELRPTWNNIMFVLGATIDALKEEFGAEFSRLWENNRVK